MREAGFTPAQQLWAAVATSGPQPVGAVVAYLLVEELEALLAFAAGATLALVLPSSSNVPASPLCGAARDVRP